MIKMPTQMKFPPFMYLHNFEKQLEHRNGSDKISHKNANTDCAQTTERRRSSSVQSKSVVQNTLQSLLF